MDKSERFSVASKDGAGQRLGDSLLSDPGYDDFVHHFAAAGG
jgi:hypothetical protein